MSEFADAVNRLRLSSSDAHLAALVSAARMPIGPGEIAQLAAVLAASGTVREPDSGCADVASTGGPGSLSTMLGPLVLRSIGLRVPKIAVPGRPAGGIDTLGTVPGYRTALPASDFQSVLDCSVRPSRARQRSRHLQCAVDPPTPVQHPGATVLEPQALAHPSEPMSRGWRWAIGEVLGSS